MREIKVELARTHNLKGVSCRIPHGQLTVVTGPSGAGKSSLAFDTVYAEGQRRFVESMSTYARQFLRQMERPDALSISGVLPSVALEARNQIKNARSTVGTISEVYDVLRLLFANVAELSCPDDHGPVRSYSPELVVEQLLESNDSPKGSTSERLVVVVPVPRPRKGANEALAELIRQGYTRRLENPDPKTGSGKVLSLEDEGAGKTPRWAGEARSAAAGSRTLHQEATVPGPVAGGSGAGLPDHDQHACPLARGAHLARLAALCTRAHLQPVRAEVFPTDPGAVLVQYPGWCLRGVPGFWTGDGDRQGTGDS